MLIVFAYDADPEGSRRFEQVYGPDGEWARFFRAGPGYLGTELHRSQGEPARYLVIDRWISSAAYDSFLDRHRDEYERRNRATQELYRRETPLGRFEAPAPSAGMTLEVLSGRYAACRLEPSAPVPAWAAGEDFCAVTRTDQELSIVCPERAVPDDVDAERGWRCLRVAGPLDFAVTGVAAVLAAPLAAAAIPILLIATHDTDYLLVRESDFARATATLSAAGHRLPPA
jgi:hypothetical protein